MPDVTVRRNPRADELEPIEKAGRDALQALRLEQLRWSLGHAYDNVPHSRARFETRGVSAEVVVIAPGASSALSAG